MSSGDKDVELLQGTLDLIILRALATMGPLHSYALATRLDNATRVTPSSAFFNEWNRTWRPQMSFGLKQLGRNGFIPDSRSA